MNRSKQSQLEHSLDILQAGPNHGWKDIEKQYRQLVQQWHPDRSTDETHSVAQNKFIEINSAYKLVRDHYKKTGIIPRHNPSRIRGEQHSSLQRGATPRNRSQQSASDQDSQHQDSTERISAKQIPSQSGLLLGTKNLTSNDRTLFSNGILVGAAIGLTIVTLVGAILWSLDSSLAENNRDRATAEKISPSENPILPSLDVSHTQETAIKQSSAGDTL